MAERIAASREALVPPDLGPYCILSAAEFERAAALASRGEADDSLTRILLDHFEDASPDGPKRRPAAEFRDRKSRGLSYSERWFPVPIEFDAP